MCAATTLAGGTTASADTLDFKVQTSQEEFNQSVWRAYMPVAGIAFGYTDRTGFTPYVQKVYRGGTLYHLMPQRDRSEIWTSDGDNMSYYYSHSGAAPASARPATIYEFRRMYFDDYTLIQALDGYAAFAGIQVNFCFTEWLIAAGVDQNTSLLSAGLYRTNPSWFGSMVFLMGDQRFRSCMVTYGGLEAAIELNWLS